MTPQNVAIDWEQGLVVPLSYRGNLDTPQGLPRRLVYWPRPGVPPVTNATIRMSKPNSLRQNASLRAKLRTVKTALAAATLIRGGTRDPHDIAVEPQFVDFSVEEILDALSGCYVDSSTNWFYRRDIVQVPHLYVPKMSPEAWSTHHANRDR